MLRSLQNGGSIMIEMLFWGGVRESLEAALLCVYGSSLHEKPGKCNGTGKKLFQPKSLSLSLSLPSEIPALIQFLFLHSL